jgi:REP element-mobilizing transposase RayT
MPRAPRPDVDGAVHHVIVRGVDGHPIVRDRKDTQKLFRLLGSSAEEFGWRWLTYCLLDNHLHAVVNTPRAGLSAGMQRFGTAYVRHFNHRHGRDGHLYQRRFFSKLVQDDAYLATLTRYVAFNPVRAGLCDRPEDWPRSAHGVLIGASDHGDLDVSAMFEFVEGPGHYARLFEIWTEDRFINDARMGYTVEEIAQRAGVTAKTVRRRLQDAGERASAGPRLTLMSTKCQAPVGHVRGGGRGSPS